MALSATARRSEPHSSKLSAEAEVTTSLQPDSLSSSRPTSPRPSISPLSTASKPAKSSPINSKDIKMQNHEEGDGGAGTNIPLDEYTAEASDVQDDRSSSLSEPEDDQENDVKPNGLKDDAQDANASATQQSLEVDSEAETDRLDQTPQKKRKHPGNAGKTPSKLGRTAAGEEDLSEPPSPLPTGPGAASSTSTLETTSMVHRSLAANGNKFRAQADIDASDKKRKRADTTESPLTSGESELGESPRKRNHESLAEDDAVEASAPTDAVGDDDIAIVDEDVAVVDDIGTPAEAQDTLNVPPTKGVKGKRGKPRGKPRKGIVKQLDTERDEGSTQADEEQGEDNIAPTAEELKYQAAASSVFDDVAKQFTAFREKLCNERLAAMTAELDMLNQPSCQHPEYLCQVACVDNRYAKQVGEIQAFYKYKHQTLRRTTLGERSQLHSQYFQHTRELREEAMYRLGEDWYNIQKERRQSHQDLDRAYTFKFPTKKSVQIRQQAKYNQEVSVLSGIAKYVGFPAAPEIVGAEGDLLEEDLKAMKISKRALSTAAPNQPMFFPLGKGHVVPGQSQAQSERLAHEQFIEQNAWARPQAPIQNHGTPNLTHTPDWAEPAAHNSNKHIIRNLSGAMPRDGSPYTTPIPQRQAALEHSSAGTVAVNSDSVELPSSFPAGRAMSAQINHGGPEPANHDTSPITISKHRYNGAPQFTGFRTISGASTIDAPPDSAEKDNAPINRHFHPGMPLETPTPQQYAFHASHIHRPTSTDHDRDSGAYPNPAFRPVEGTFGTPAPLPATSAP